MGPQAAESAPRAGADWDPRLEIAAHLEISLPLLRDQIYERFCAEIPEYQDGRMFASRRQVEVSIEALASLFIRTAREGRRLSAAELAGLSTLAVERADQGLPQDALLSALRVAMKVGWEETAGWVTSLPTAAAMMPALTETAFGLLEFIDDITQALSGTFLRRRERALGERERRRRELVDDLLNGPIDEESHLAGRGLEMGFNLRASHGLVVTAVHRSSTLSKQPRVRQLVPPTGAFVLETTESGQRVDVVVVPAPTAASWRVTVAGVREQVAGSALVGVFSDPCENLACLRREHRRLLRLLPWAMTIFGPGSLVSSAQVAVYALIGAATPADREAFVTEALGPLMALPAGAGEALLETIAAMFELGSVSLAAQRLNVHPKTVQYRIARVSELTGLCWRVPADRLRLDLALHLHDLALSERGDRREQRSRLGDVPFSARAGGQ
jgi:DNA-binding PucR family transcriptional regulator